MTNKKPKQDQNTDANPTTLGFIGVGVMGEPMCRHLAQKSNLQILAADQQQAPLKRLASFGVQNSTVDEVARRADVIFMSLPSGEIMRQLVVGQHGLESKLPSGCIVVDLSTSAVDDTRVVAEQLNARGIHFADAPVMRTRAAAEAGNLAIPVGADNATFETIKPLLATFATDITHVGAVGAGQVVKILNNMVLYETVLALSEACAISRRVGVDPQILFEAFSTGSADSFALRNHGMNAVVPQKFPELTFPVSYLKKDITYAVDLAEQMGVGASGARNLLTTINRTMEAGHGEKYAPAISLLFEE